MVPVNILERQGRLGRDWRGHRIGPGIYRLPWTPELVAGLDRRIRFRGKTLDKQKIDKSWNLTVNPPTAIGRPSRWTPRS